MSKDIQTDHLVEMAFIDLTKAYLNSGYSMEDLQATLSDALSQTQLVENPLQKVEVKIKVKLR